MKRIILTATITLALILCLCEINNHPTISELTKSQAQSIDFKEYTLILLESRIPISNQIKIKRQDNLFCIFNDPLCSSLTTILIDTQILPIVIVVDDGLFISNDQSPGENSKTNESTMVLVS